MINKRYLKPKDIAMLLMLNVLTIYEYIKKGKLKAIKFGRNYRVEEEDLNKFINEHIVKKENYL